MRCRTALAPLFLLVTSSCGHARAPASTHSATPGPPATVANKAEDSETLHGTTTQDGAIGTYVSIPWGFSTSSYWIEGPTGLIAIDTQFLPSAAEEMIAEAEARTKKKFVLAIVLHTNPDKFNGTATFQKHGVKVVTSSQVAAGIPAVHAARTAAFAERYLPDYPTDLPKPDAFGNKTMELDAAGTKVRLHVMGAGCSEAHVVVEHDGAVFPGDLIANRNHAWLEIGKTDEWLKRLAEMKHLSPRSVHPGRGPAGGAKLLDDQQAYLEKVISIVATEKPTLPRDEAALARAEQAVVRAYPDYGFPVFLKIGLPAEWARQSVNRTPPGRSSPGRP